MEKIKLNNGLKIPAIGIGTFPMNRFTIFRVINQALYLGYRKIDTASAYSNESWIGRALKFNLIKRKNVFITTKLSNSDQRIGNIDEALNKSLKKLGVKYVDLYLMHWPNPDTFIKSWIEMEKLYKKGLVKGIGVCNFHEHHLEKLLKVATVVPAINQIERHPLLSQKELIDYCQNEGIRVEAYSPFARMDEKLIRNKILMKISEKYNKTIPQIILRWNYQGGIPTVPKTSNKQRLKQNIDIFDFKLTKQEMHDIDNLNKDYRVRYNPDTCDFDKL